MDRLNELLNLALNKIAEAKDLQTLNNLRVLYLGKKGLIPEYLKNISCIPLEERRRTGQVINNIKQELESNFKKRKQSLELIDYDSYNLDITLPSRGQKPGGIHPIRQVLEKIEDIFSSFGFIAAFGPEIEDEFHNFEALNIAQLHPARTMQDTFYINQPGFLLRTHTSPVQIRVLDVRKPPIRIIAPGCVYRRDSDLTHSPMFHQVEGLVVDTEISFTNLIEVLDNFLKIFFEKENLTIRFRPSYFPFTEPSAEVDIKCFSCNGIGCRICKNSGWLEILGCGMVHTKVLDNLCIDSELYTGYAFGVGVERLAMLYYDINDIRLFFENDLRFLEQF